MTPTDHAARGCPQARRTESRRIDFRIGVSLGDIITDGDDVFGDGVAARLEAMADWRFPPLRF
jgi:class 3 adenylate cyclase